MSRDAYDAFADLYDAFTWVHDWTWRRRPPPAGQPRSTCVRSPGTGESPWRGAPSAPSAGH